MVDPVPTGSGVSAGTYRCANRGQKPAMHSEQSLPSCPGCEGPSFDTVCGGDSVQDPYPGER